MKMKANSLSFFFTTSEIKSNIKCLSLSAGGERGKLKEIERASERERGLTFSTFAPNFFHGIDLGIREGQNEKRKNRITQSKRKVHG